MEGFFEELGIIETNDKKGKEYTCLDCGLKTSDHSYRNMYRGEGKKEILIISDFLNNSENELSLLLEELGFNLDKDFWKIPPIKCKLLKGYSFTPVQINACRKNVMNTFNELSPKGVILLGHSAYDSFLGYRMSGRLSKVKFNDFIGECIPDQEFKSWVGVTYEFYHIQKFKWDKVLKKIFKNHLLSFVEKMKKDIEIIDYSKKVIIVKEEEEATNIIDDLRKNRKALAFDYETDGIKPQREGHKIYYASVSDGERAWAFPFFEGVDFRNSWKKFLKSPNIIKTAHSKRFETIWTKFINGYYVRKPFWCTSIGAHCLDNKKKTSLKFLTYTVFGILGYDNSIDKYITKVRLGEDPKSKNSFNRIDEAPEEDILYYNGLDSLFTFWLYKIQAVKLKKEFLEGFLFLSEGDQVLAEVHLKGIQINSEKMEYWQNKIVRKTNLISKRIYDSPEVEKWDGKKPFSFTSNKDLPHLLFDIMGLKSKKKTSGGKPSIDKETLSDIDHPFVDRIMEYRKWEKIVGTYMAQFEREKVGNLIYPFYNLNGVVTFRSSASDPNPQNIPHREKQTTKIIRSLLEPRPGCRLIEWDYGQHEVIVAACRTEDPNLIDYVCDPTKDMHRDMGEELFLKPGKDIDKIERYIAKNQFVFREFYGGYWEQAGPEMWGVLPDYTKSHLLKKGIKTERDFTHHVEKVENILWREKFPVFAEWKNKTFKNYERKGYVDLMTGFRCYGPMGRNDIINYQIQGPAFHVLLWTLIYVHKELKRRKIKRSFFIGQIHDSAIGNAHEEEEELFDELMTEWGLGKVRDHWKWIIVPLKLEKKRSAIDGDWSEMEDCGLMNK